ncbi:MAG TPA: di-trans,poly-cis-decaprenylcistransferase, partial [Clostridiaceae bacterium]|nr:di-trans,poly-cis-decaprenylcistransferase [Clostridiaceae bacterium]
HREGSNTIKEIVEYCAEIGIEYLTIYAFSTENWNRPRSEVDYLMSLIQEFLQDAEQNLSGKNVQIRIIGNIIGLSKDLQEEIPKIVEMTGHNTGLILNIALNYGGRDEIVNALRQIANEIKDNKINIDDVNEQLISYKLYTGDVPDPDLLIRTGGEKRLSNFLLWQIAYTEIWCSDVLWPDFTKEDLLKAIYDYQNRERRYGGI